MIATKGQFEDDWQDTEEQEVELEDWQWNDEDWYEQSVQSNSGYCAREQEQHMAYDQVAEQNEHWDEGPEEEWEEEEWEEGEDHWQEDLQINNQNTLTSSCQHKDAQVYNTEWRESQWLAEA